MIARSELHELACSDSGKGCVCNKPRLTPLQARHIVDYAVHNGVDVHLSSLESLLITLEQRELDEAQLDRFGRLLQYGERMALSRLRRAR